MATMAAKSQPTGRPRIKTASQCTKRMPQIARRLDRMPADGGLAAEDADENDQGIARIMRKNVLMRESLSG
jgi:hypothetical protein